MNEQSQSTKAIAAIANEPPECAQVEMYGTGENLKMGEWLRY
jgi:hypothetical protein